ncbi:MAG TPA: DUF4070 domain-containing protein [Solirubrobacteraceae bacterium]|nr:DUF4070 domain-containing protein [Solirubrobacteraceae bacterium]
MRHILCVFPRDRHSFGTFDHALLVSDSLMGSVQFSNGWRRTLRGAYAPEAILSRCDHQLRTTYTRRRALPARRPSWPELRHGPGVLGRAFWRVALPALRRGQLEEGEAAAAEKAAA